MCMLPHTYTCTAEFVVAAAASSSIADIHIQVLFLFLADRPCADTGAQYTLETL